ncbi:MAG: ion channel [Oleiphilaceae bacterium]|nr:ion channel [Oleiphilaceae bacterium]
MLTPMQRQSFEHQEAHPHTPGRLMRRRIRFLMLLLLALIASHGLLMMLLEGLSLPDAFWLTFTTLVTVGYGDLSPATHAGRLATILLLYITAITTVTLIISDYIEYRFYRRERILTGRWRLNVKDHILIINAPHHAAPQYFNRLIRQLRLDSSYSQTPIVLLSNRYPQGMPTEMQDIGLHLIHGSGNQSQALDRAQVSRARHIVVLANDEGDSDSDSMTFDILHRLEERKLSRRAVVECVTDDNRQRLEALRPMSVIRPVRTYPEIMVRALQAPGSEKVLEDLFNYEQDHPHRFNLTVSDLTWAQVVSALISADLGTAMAYIDKDNRVVCHPPADQEIQATGLILLVKTSTSPDTPEVRQALDQHRQFLQQWRQFSRESGPVTD